MLKFRLYLRGNFCRPNRLLCCLAIWSLFINGIQAQIVNMESARMQTDTTGWKGTASLGFSLSKNTTQVSSFLSSAHVQYKSKKNLYLLLGSSEFLKSDGSSLINNSFAHFRINRKYGPKLRWEWYTQFQNNAVTGIAFRILLGTGPRFKLRETDKFKDYLGISLMYEYEKDKIAPVDGGDVYHRDVRGNFYFSFSYRPEASTELVSTTLLQPLIRDFSDCRFMQQMSFRIKPGKKFDARFDLNYLYDPYPVPGKPKTNYRFGTGIGYNF